MNNSKNDPDFSFEEYKGFTIASHKNNTAEENLENLIIVYPPGEYPEHGYIVGLDDSKDSDGRRSVPCNLEDARNYIDWVTKCRQEKMAVKPQISKQKNGRKPRM
ncbi:hypothetical protein [Chitinophaga sp. GbtcB8]|uniref:hypothetical protein n=1 Tax=Chitinophaga sp. GbtcB8 TaxID=2824753 RepID=UPI001C2FFE00|nr:hypothetical protein [Chitinophaga sp. GbtcB8]